MAELNIQYPKLIADAVAQHFVDSGATNYTGDVYTVTVDATEQQFEIVVTTQLVGAKSPHDIAVEKAERLAKAEALLLDISNWLVCEAIATPEDMAQSFTGFREAIDLFLDGGE